MWMREKLEENKGTLRFARGKVVSSGNGLSVSGEENLRQPEVIAPYGFYFRLPVGSSVLGAEGKILGVPMEDIPELNEGEILIRNIFGAEIKFSVDGAVEINGQRFERSGD